MGKADKQLSRKPPAQRPAPDIRRLATALSLWLLLAASAGAVRIKDLASFEGARPNQLIGYGIVVGLDDTGDSDDSPFTAQSLASFLRRQGINVDASEIDGKNSAAVVVTATLPPFAHPGMTIDVVVNSLGDAKSLFGGTLLQTPLRAHDGKVYAVAQGPISTGGFGASQGGTQVQKNHLTSARLSNGAIVERPAPQTLQGRNEICLLLHNPDFTTALRMARVINHELGMNVAQAEDPGRVSVALPPAQRGREVEYIASIERLEVSPDTPAVVVVNERTGTIVMGADVKISTVAVAHGSLNIQISQLNLVSQPEAFSQGQTTEYSQTAVALQEGAGQLGVVYEGVSISEVVRALNAIGVTPRDLIAILKAIKAAGALQAELEII